jgi:hypothetical protein
MADPTPLSDWKLETRAAEGADVPGEAERLATLRASNEEILAKYPAAGVAAEVKRRQTAKRRPLFWLAIPVVALAALLLVPRHSPEDGPERIKGLEAHLVAFKQTREGPEQLPPEAPAKAGELIQLRCVTAGQRFGAVVSVDGRGGVTLHYPEEAAGSTSLSAGEMALPHSYQLDDAPAFERFFFVTSDQPVDVPRLLAAANLLARSPEHARRDPLPLVDARHQSSLLLKKVSP